MNLLLRKHIEPNNTCLENRALPPLQSRVFIEEIIIIWFNVLVNPETLSLRNAILEDVFLKRVECS